MFYLLQCYEGARIHLGRILCVYHHHAPFSNPDTNLTARNLAGCRHVDATPELLNQSLQGAPNHW